MRLTRTLTVVAISAVVLIALACGGDDGGTGGGDANAGVREIHLRMTDQIRTVRGEFYDKSRPPASTMLGFEGLPSLDASLAVDVIAVLEN